MSSNTPIIKPERGAGAVPVVSSLSQEYVSKLKAYASLKYL
jgi:hypothetical protein